MNASFEALRRWWATLSDDDRASLRRAARTGEPDERANALLRGRGALWAVYDTYVRRDKQSRGARLADNVRQFILRHGGPDERRPRQ